MIKMILACERSGAIGYSDGQLPWRIPEDLRRFKELTYGSTVVMGWNTFKSLNMPHGLPGRKNIIITSKPYHEVKDRIGADVLTISSLEYLTQVVQENGTVQGRFSNDDCWIIGGAALYNSAMAADIVDEIYLTQVNEVTEADVRINIDLFNWKHFVISRKGLWEAEIPEQPRDARIGYITFRRNRGLKT